MKRRTFLSVLAAGQLVACSRPASDSHSGTTLSGVTMGTTYSVTVPKVMPAVQSDSLHSDIDNVLRTIVESMSTYDPVSELSTFNRSTDTHWRLVSPELFAVFEAASVANEFSEGAFDVTVGRLVDLWGFGPRLRSGVRPNPAELKREHARVGQHLLSLDSQSRSVRKHRAEVHVDLSSIAKGYGVDKVASLLEAHGFTDYLVEIGGEIRVRGAGASGRAWRLGVEAPVAHRRVAKIIEFGKELDRGGIATSGNYRHYFDQGERRYPHVLSPVSGEPVNHPPMSVTAVSESAMQADALATALPVMGPDAGYRFASAQGLTALLAFVCFTSQYVIRLPDSLSNK